MLYVKKEDISLTYLLLHKFLVSKGLGTKINAFLKPLVNERPDLIDGKKINFDTFFANISKILPRSEKYLVKYVKMSCLVRNSGKEFSASVLESIKAGVSESESKRDVTKKEISELNLLNQSWEKLDEEAKGKLLDQSWEKVDEAVFRILEEYKYFDPRGSRLISSIFGEMHKVTSDQDLIGIARIDPDLTGTARLDELIKHVSDMIREKNYSGILQLVEQGQWKFGDYPDEQQHRKYVIKQKLDDEIDKILDLVEKSNPTVAGYFSSMATFFGSQAGETKSAGAVQSNNCFMENGK